MKKTLGALGGYVLALIGLAFIVGFIIAAGAVLASLIGQ